MQINRNNLKEFINNLNEEEIYNVEIDSIVDAGINPREVDVKYAEQIPQSAPPILLGIIKDDNELKNSLIIIDGNHRLYSYMNVHEQEYIPAKIKYYNKRGEAIIDAYKLNMLHGRRLTDKQIYIGIRKTLEFLKGEDTDKTYKELCELLNLSKSGLYEYQIWIKISKMLKCDIDKTKSNKLNVLLKDTEDGEKNLKLFWELNKNLSTRGINDAIKYFRETGKIVDWDKHKATAIIFNDDEDDGLIEKEKKLTKIGEVQQAVKEMTYQDENDSEDDDEEEFEIDNVIEEENPTENNITEYNDEETVEELNDNDYNINKFVSNNKPIEEGRKIETGKLKEKKDDHLVSVPGLVRKYSFETVMNNVFEELTEGVITSQNSLNEVLEKHLHDNRQIFESKKEEYIRALDNIDYILKKMRKTIEKANKDFKD